VIAFFDCLHDRRPGGVARHARQALKADGTAMIVEPFANDKLQDHLNALSFASCTAPLANMRAVSGWRAKGSRWGRRRANARIAVKSVTGADSVNFVARRDSVQFGVGGAARSLRGVESAGRRRRAQRAAF